MYEEQSLHFVMSKAIRSTSIIKTFSLLNNFSSTPVAISQIRVPKNATQYFKVIVLLVFNFNTWLLIIECQCFTLTKLNCTKLVYF